MNLALQTLAMVAASNDTTYPVTAFPDFLAGFVNDTIVRNNMTMTKSCLDFVRKESELSLDAMNNLALGDMDAAIAKAKAIGATLMDQCDSCKAAVPELMAFEKFTRTFADTAALEATVTKNYLLHQKEVNDDLAAFAKAYAAADYNTCGDLASKISNLCLGNVPMPTVMFNNELTFEAVSVPEFLAGLVYGFTNNNHLSEFETCLTDVDNVYKTIESAITDFKSSDILKGVTDVGMIIATVPTSAENCYETKEDIAKIEAWGKQFEDVTTLTAAVLSHFMMHASEVTGLIDDMSTSWDSGKYFKTGEDLAKMLTTLVGPIDGFNMALLQ